MAYIVIDPGHGAHDSGAVGYGIYEKNVVLELAKKVNDCLGKFDGVTVSLTRWDDRFLELAQRANFANNKKCDLFISLHNNSASSSQANGFESFVYTSASSKSRAYQKTIHTQVMKYLAPYGIKDRGMKNANFAVLRLTKMPSILLENLFINNQKENNLLKDTKFLDGLAEAIATGIANIFGLKKKQPKPMYRVIVDGKIIYDTAYESKITDAVLNAVKNNAQKIELSRL